MKLNEYEERFQRPVPSWHQILAANQTRNRIRLRKWRYSLATALMAVATITVELASRRTAHGHGGTGSAAGPGFHDRYRATDRADCPRSGVGTGDDHVRVPPDDIASEIGIALGPPSAGIPLDCENFVLDIAQPTQLFEKWLVRAGD